MEIKGYVAPGYEAVRETFASGARELDDDGTLNGGGSFSAIVDGEVVADLHGGRGRDGAPWAEDTLAILMSATKALGAASVMLLADRGLIDVDGPVQKMWPEFRDERVTVRHVMTHS